MNTTTTGGWKFCSGYSKVNCELLSSIDWRLHACQQAIGSVDSYHYSDDAGFIISFLHSFIDPLRIRVEVVAVFNVFAVVVVFCCLQF